MNKNVPLLSQERLPGLWKLFQWTIGGTIDKRKLALLKYRGQKEILEIGCSVGNVAVAFKGIPDIHYTGLDIDPSAIRRAQKDFRKWKNFSFVCDDLTAYARSTRKKYDYILFASVAHHVSDPVLIEMLEAARDLLSQDGILVVEDPVTPKPTDGWFVHLYIKMERGVFVRRFSDLRDIVSGIPKLRLCEAEERMIGATPLSSPPTANRFGIFTLEWADGQGPS